MKSDIKQLPKNWVLITLNDIRIGKNPSILPNKQPDKFFELYSVPSFDNHKPEIVQGKQIGSNKQIVYTDDVLLCKINPRINRVWIVGEFSEHQKIASTEWIPFNKLEGIYPKFLAYYMLQTDFSSYLSLTASGVGGSLMRTNTSKVGKYPFILAPYNEQVRIVSKIEELLSRLDSGVQALQKTQQQLEWYKQSTLKQAFTGKLTEKWRKEHNIHIDYQINDNNLLIIPSTWTWKKVKEIGQVITGTTPNKSVLKYYGNDYPFYKPTDLNNGYYVKDSFDGLSELGLEKAKYLPEKSILVTCIGATIGKTGFIRKPGASNQQINSIVPNYDMYPEFIYFICTSSPLQNMIKKNASATTLPILNKSKFMELDFPIPPYNEQIEIVDNIEKHLSIIENNDLKLNQIITNCAVLKKALLKKAFEGRLVPQGPNDEPATILLERIKIEREKLKPIQKKDRRKAHAIRKKGDRKFVFRLKPVNKTRPKERLKGFG